MKFDPSFGRPKALPIEGPLVLLGTGIAISPFSHTLSLYLFAGREFALPTNVINMYIFNMVLWLPLSIMLAISFFKQKRSFVKFYMVFTFLYFLSIVVNDFFLQSIFKNYSNFKGTERSLLVASIWAVIWVPYLLLSRRAKRTFVN